MQDFDNWDDIQEKEVGDFPHIPADGYVMQIVKAEIATSRNGNEMLVLALEVHEGDFKGYYKEYFEYKKKYQPNYKWPCIFRQLTRGNSTSYFKRLISNIEHSNQGYSFKGSGFDESTLKGKLVGFVLRDEEWDHDGKKGFTAKPYTSRTITDIRNKNFEIPKPLLLDGTKSDTTTSTYYASTSNNYGNDIIDNSNKYDDMEVPF